MANHPTVFKIINQNIVVRERVWLFILTILRAASMAKNVTFAVQITHKPAQNPFGFFFSKDQDNSELDILDFLDWKIHLMPVSKNRGERFQSGYEELFNSDKCIPHLIFCLW